MNINPDKDCMGYRPLLPNAAKGGPTHGPYKWLSYRQVAERRADFGSGMKKLQKDDIGTVDKGWNLGIYSVSCLSLGAYHLLCVLVMKESADICYTWYCFPDVGIEQVNKLEWQIADLAAVAFSIITVPLYDTLGPGAVEYILNHASIPMALCSMNKIQTFIDLAEKCPQLKVVIYIDDTPFKEIDNLKKEAEAKGLKLYSFSEVEKIGTRNRIPFEYPTSTDVAWISYTSGTTGTPKGAMLIHKNIVQLFFSQLDNGLELETKDTHISYLPLAHIYERMVLNFSLMRNARIGFFRGDGEALWS
jgi:long-chain acyl-CoA synthetase